jgi:hypothetical protein
MMLISATTASSNTKLPSRETVSMHAILRGARQLPKPYTSGDNSGAAAHFSALLRNWETPKGY